MPRSIVCVAAAVVAGIIGATGSAEATDLTTTAYYHQLQATNSANLPAAQIPWSQYQYVTQGAIFPSDSAGNLDTTSYLVGTLNPLTNNTYAYDFVTAAHNNGKKALISLVAGPNQSSYIYSDTKSTSTANALAANLAQVVNTSGYDGIDLDLEYGIYGSYQIDNLVTALRNVLPNTTITYAASLGQRNYIAQATTLPQINQVNLMSYQYGTATYGGTPATAKTWFNSPLLAGHPMTSNTSSDYRSIEEDVWYWEQAGVAANKIGILLPGFAEMQNINGVVTPGTAYPGGVVSAATFPSDRYFTDSTSNQFYKYKDYWPNADYGVTVTINGKQVTKLWDDAHQAPYISVVDPLNSANDQYITFSDAQEMTALINWAQNNGLRGVGMFDLSDEYVATATGAAQFPLSAAVSAAVPEPTLLGILATSGLILLLRRRAGREL